MDLASHPQTGELLTAEVLDRMGQPHLPGLLGLRITALEPDTVHARLEVGPQHLAANGYLHAATVTALADTAAGCGALTFRPKESSGFTTVELKANFLGTVREGVITVSARKVHGGRTTQVWDAEVIEEATGKPIALFRCTQMILYPRA